MVAERFLSRRVRSHLNSDLYLDKLPILTLFAFPHFITTIRSTHPGMLSCRAAQFAQTGFAHGEKHPYHPRDCPDGEVNFANAENSLIRDELTRYINTHNTFATQCSSYNEGFTGNYQLRSAMAGHINAHFNPAKPVEHEDLTFAAGVTELNEVCAFLFCDHGKREAIMLGRPIYGSFKPDLALRTG